MASGLLYAYVLDGKGGARKLDWDGLRAWGSNDGILWVDLDYTEADAAAWLASATGIDPLALGALTDPDPRPRAVAFGDELLLIVRGINRNEGASPEDMISIRSWVEPRRVITLHHRRSQSLRTIAADLDAGKGPRTAADLATMLVEYIVEHVVTRVDTLGDEVAACEDQVVTGVEADLRARIADHRRRAIALRRFLAPQREALGKLGAITLPWFDASHRARVIEAADRMTRTVEELDAVRDRAAVTQEELGSRVAEMTNQRLYTLSIVTTIFLPLGFLTAVLSVPLPKDEPAFWVMCGAFAIAVLGQVWLFRRRGWL
jgi:zinc transporter